MGTLHARDAFLVLALLFELSCRGGSGAAVPAPLPASVPADQSRVVFDHLLPMVEVQGRNPVRYALDERMAHFHVPGASIAVVDRGTLAWARGVGLREAGQVDPVYSTTVFEAGSVSKPVTATATLRLVDEAKMSLDENVNTYLRTWKVPDGEVTAKEKVTLRRILSHSAGTTVHGFPGYGINEPLPTLLQVLEGVKPANTQAVVVEFVPGSRSLYSGGGVAIEQQALTDITGKAFPALLDELVLRPVGMTRSTFEQPLPQAWRSDAAAAHDTAGAVIPGRFHVYPEMAAAGLWSTPTDLMKWAMAIDASRTGDNGAVLSKSSAREMLSMQKAPFGLGPVLQGSGRAFHYGHEGEDEGFLCEVVYFPETAQGAAVMVNGGGGRPLVREVLYAIAATYGWPDFAPTKIAATMPDPRMMDRVVGNYEALYEVYRVAMSVRRSNDRLFIRSARLGIDSEVVFTSPTTLTTLDGGDELEIVLGAGNRITSLRYGDFEILRRDESAVE